MKAVIINGSARKGGAVSTMLNAIRKGLQDVGAEIMQYTLDEMNFKGCRGCMYCKNKGPFCIRQDDLTDTYPDIAQADVLVLGMPIYMFGISGQMELWINRMYPMVSLSHEPRYPGKKVITVYSQANVDTDAYKSEKERIRMVIEWMGFEEIKRFDVSGVPPMQARASVSAELIQEAYQAGVRYGKEGCA